MTPEEIAKNIRNTLENLVQFLQDADNAGLSVNYDIRKDDKGQRYVADFRVLQTVTIAQD